MNRFRYENQSVVARVAKNLDCTTERACEVFDEMIEFLGTCATLGDGTPTHDVDEAWHAFILHTKDYAEFCQMFMGHFLHHTPRARTCDGTFDITKGTCDYQCCSSGGKIEQAAA